jgi:glucokinase
MTETGNGYFIGFDVGGTRLKSGVVRPDGTVERPTLEDTSRGGFEDVVLPLLREHARDLVASMGPGCEGIGIALPGIVETAFGSRYLPGKVLGIEGFPLRDTLEREFGVPVRCINDGAAATLAEWQFGAARGIDDVVGLTLGTGVGSGVVVGGRPFETSNLGNGVSVGHFTIDTGGRLCLCGNRGCAETLVSANAVAGRLREALGRKVPSVLAERFRDDPHSIGFPALVDGVRAGDRICLEILGSFVRDLGATIVTAIHAYNPTVVVLAGGPLSAADLFLADVQAYVDEYAFIFPKGRVVKLRVAQLGDHTGVLGAAAVVMSAVAETDP